MRKGKFVVETQVVPGVERSKISTELVDIEEEDEAIVSPATTINIYGGQSSASARNCDKKG